MAQYDMPKADFDEAIGGQNISEGTKTAIAQMFEGRDSVNVADYDPADPPGDDVDVVNVPSGVTPEQDPGGSYVVFQGQASGNFSASEAGRAIAAQSDDNQNLSFSGQGKVTVETGAGNDVISVNPDDLEVTVDAGGGFDVFNVAKDRSEYGFEVDEDGNVVITGSSFTLANIEAIQFEDALSVVAQDEDQAIVGRMYQTLFDREPDKEGLEYWFDTLAEASFDDGTYDMWDVTHAFMVSDEYQEKYSKLDDEQFLNELYEGMASRTPEDEEVAYWMDVLENPEDHIDPDVWKGDEDNAQVHVVYAFGYSEEAEEVMGLEGTSYIIPTYDDDEA